MNSEELEQSLRTEFESHLKQISADMQREAAEFQEKIEAEFERHRTQLTEVFQNFSARAQVAEELDANFKDSVVEHLRLARDEGATITATAIGEAEKLQKEAADNAPPVAGISELRDGINDISSQTSQATILKSLVEQAGQFTPRGAFFIVKNEQFVGWRVFGNEGHSDDEAVREIAFPVSADSTLGESVNSLSAVEGSFGTRADDSIYLDKLQFGEPEKMFAIPLVARGRGVAVLYADRGTTDAEVNIEALETLVRVAGMTVEILAAAPGVKPASARQVEKPAAVEEPREAAEPTNYDTQEDYRVSEELPQPEMAETAEAVETVEAAETAVSYDSSTLVEPAETAAESAYQYVAEEENLPAQPDFQPQTALTDFNYNDYSVEDYSVEEIEVVEEDDEAVEEIEPVEAADEMPATVEVFQPNYDDAPPAAESYSWNQPAEAPAEFTGDFAAESPVQFEQPAFEPTPTVSFERETFEPPTVAENEYSTPVADEYQFETAQSFERAETQIQETPPSFDSTAFESALDYSPAVEENLPSFEPQNGAAAMEEVISAKPAAEVVTEPAVAVKPARSRFNDRNVDLPIEVTEDERRLHNDARRFARLLVSEIKLYNEQKVKDGRSGSDLYEKLREAIDRSREMYDKRIQPPVAAKFDYFHYEVVSTLAEGDEAKLGEDYPGATV